MTFEEVPGGRYCIGFCPLCGGGLCGVRACCFVDDKPTKGMVMCDECDAMWLEPDLTGPHVYPDPEEPVCPRSGLPLFHSESRWATSDDIDTLGWKDLVDPQLTLHPSLHDVPEAGPEPERLT